MEKAVENSQTLTMENKTGRKSTVNKQHVFSK